MKGDPKQEHNERMDDAEWEHVLNAIFQIFAISDFSSFQEKTLSYLGMLIPNYQSVFNLLDFSEGTPKPTDSIWLGAEPISWEKFLAGNYYQDKDYQGLYIRPKTHVIREPIPSPEQTSDFRLYNEIYKPQGIRYGLSAILSHEGVVLGEVLLYREEGESDFSEKELRLLELLAPFIALHLEKLLSLRSGKDENPRDIPKEKTIFDRYDLTQREQEVLMLILEGKSTTETADRLFVSVSTIKKHLNNIYRKTQAKNRLELYEQFR